MYHRINSVTVTQSIFAGVTVYLRTWYSVFRIISYESETMYLETWQDVLLCIL